MTEEPEMRGGLGTVYAIIMKIPTLPLRLGFKLARYMKGFGITQDDWEEAMKELEDAGENPAADELYEDLKEYGSKKGWE